MNSRSGRAPTRSRGSGRRSRREPSARVGRALRAGGPAILSATILLAVWSALRGQPPAEEPATSAISEIEIDREKLELRIPCRFVNPSRVLEVFACHRKGPTHETVVEFDATGPVLNQALVELGCRSGGKWNITSPTDFLQTQGDRILIVVRWTHQGKTREYPAEGLLHDGEFGFPAFVRGFSFDARTPADSRQVADAPAIPEIVEVTLGGTRRQSPSYSLLRHPTTSARLERWMLPPVVNPDVVEDLPGLVEHQVPAVLILRRLSSERELITYLRSVAARRGVTDRLPVYDRLEPLADAIDALKKELRELAARLEKLIEGSDEQGRARTIELLRHGRWLVERIEAAYLAMYEIQEDFKLAWLRGREDIPEPLVEEAQVLVRDGFKFEPLLSQRRVALAQLDRQAVSEDSPARLKLLKEMDILEKERDSRLVEANLRYVRGRLEALEEDDDYLKELFSSDVYRLDVKLRLLAAERAVLQSEVDELVARRDARWESSQEAILKRQRVSRQQVVIAQLEEKRAETLDELRWARNDLESRVEDRRRRAEESLREFTKAKEALDRQIADARADLRRLQDG